MSRPRSFDYDEATRLRAEGIAVMDLAAKYGVSVKMIYLATHPEKRAHYNAYSSEWQKTHRVPCANGCGALVHGRYRPGAFCKTCAATASRTTVREGELCCHTCHVWKRDLDFPNNRGGKGKYRRGRHGTCRACHTAIKRAYREKHRVPCSHGCGRMVDSIDVRDKTKPPECHPCAMRRISGRTREQVAA